ncbi:hypothetical protein [Runella sp.]|uniref:hypothetical protein n=1 Tax=Runella sp. TaxID=1960881 RepID=UPI003D0AB059
MKSIAELLEYIESHLTIQRENIPESQLEILTHIFSDHEEALKRLAENGKPFIIILGSNLSGLEPLLSQKFKTHVSPLISPNQILIMSDEWESLRFRFPPEPPVLTDDFYAFARIDSSPWWDIYKHFKNKSDGDTRFL